LMLIERVEVINSVVQIVASRRSNHVIEQISGCKRCKLLSPSKKKIF
jgi:hypothetical protein